MAALRLMLARLLMWVTDWFGYVEPFRALPPLQANIGTLVSGSSTDRTWTTEDWHPAEPLRIVNFDPTFNDINLDIDPTTDVAYPDSKHHIN